MSINLIANYAGARMLAVPSPGVEAVVSAGGFGVTDPYWSSVVLLAFNENGADASTTFDDASNANHTLTANGNAQWDTAQAPTGLTSSALFDGTGDSITTNSSASFAFGTGDFTVEFFMRTADTIGDIIHLAPGSAGNWGVTFHSFQESIYWQTQSGGTNL